MRPRRPRARPRAHHHRPQASSVHSSPSVSDNLLHRPFAPPLRPRRVIVEQRQHKHAKHSANVRPSSTPLTSDSPPSPPSARDYSSSSTTLATPSVRDHRWQFPPREQLLCAHTSTDGASSAPSVPQAIRHRPLHSALLPPRQHTPTMLQWQSPPRLHHRH